MYFLFQVVGWRKQTNFKQQKVLLTEKKCEKWFSLLVTSYYLPVNEFNPGNGFKYENSGCHVRLQWLGPLLRQKNRYSESKQI